VQGLEERLPREVAARAQRSFRLWLSHRLRYRVRGGVFLDWRGTFALAALGVHDELVTFYTPDSFEAAK
jgi:hypothetical protein